MRMCAIRGFYCNLIRNLSYKITCFFQANWKGLEGWVSQAQIKLPKRQVKSHVGWVQVKSLKSWKSPVILNTSESSLASFRFIQVLLESKSLVSSAFFFCECQSVQICGYIVAAVQWLDLKHHVYLPVREGGDPTGVEGLEEKLLFVWSGE